jgi:hypothetical protein
MFLSYSKAAGQSVFVRVVRSPDHENMGPFFFRGTRGGRCRAHREGRRICVRRLPKPGRHSAQERSWGQAPAHWHGICGLQHPSRRQCLHNVYSMLVGSPRVFWFRPSHSVFDAQPNHRKSEVTSGPRFSLHSVSYQPRVVCLAFSHDKCNDMPVNNLDPLIRRFKASDYEPSLNIRELERRKAAKVAR